MHLAMQRTHQSVKMTSGVGNTFYLLSSLLPSHAQLGLEVFLNLHCIFSLFLYVVYDLNNFRLLIIESLDKVQIFWEGQKNLKRSQFVLTLLKFRYSEKATKFWKISNVEGIWRFFQTYVALSEYLNYE